MSVAESFMALTLDDVNGGDSLALLSMVAKKQRRGRKREAEGTEDEREDEEDGEQAGNGLFRCHLQPSLSEHQLADVKSRKNLNVDDAKKESPLSPFFPLSKNLALPS